MTRPADDRILAFLEGEMEAEERVRFIEELEASPAFAREIQLANMGLKAVQGARPEANAVSSNGTSRALRVSPWWVLAAAAATLAVAVPSTLAWSGSGISSGAQAVEAYGRPSAPEPSFVLLLHRRWPDAATVDDAETDRRAREYWAWTSSLAEDDVLVAAGDLRWEAGERLGPQGQVSLLAPEAVTDAEFLVGMFAVRVDTYQEALALARDCPHLRYGGSVSVRRVGAGFVTAAGLGDWGG